MQKTLLCFGDSNTWGYDPSTPDTTYPPNRYTRQQRWPGRLQQLLGESWYVVEEGLGGRTTDLDTPMYPNRNAKPYLVPCLYSHAPIDLMILSLGLNDFKSYFNKSVSAVEQSLQDLIQMIQQSYYGKDMNQAPKLLLMTPPIPLPSCERYQDPEGTFAFQGICEKARQLAVAYQRLATNNNCYFLDVSQDVVVSALDGIHYDAKGHQAIAALIFAKINTLS